MPTRTDLPESPALSILLNGPESFAGRKLGVLVTDGSDKALVNAVASAFEDAGAVVEYVAPAIGPVKLKGGGTITPDHAIDGGPSVLFDAVALLPSAEGAADLAGRASAQDFVSDAFAHHKFVGLGADAAALLAAAGVEPDEGFADLAAARTTPPASCRCAVAAALGPRRACLRTRPVLIGPAGRDHDQLADLRPAPGRPPVTCRPRSRSPQSSATSCRRPGAGRTAAPVVGAGDGGAADLTVARVLEPHLDALAILAQAGVPADSGTWGVFAAEGPGEPLRATRRRFGVPARAAASTGARSGACSTARW